MAEYEKHRLLRSPLTGQVYYVPKARILSEKGGRGVLQVVGAKYDVTDDFMRILDEIERERDTNQDSGEEIA